MDIYSLSRNFWDYAFENPEKIKPNHISVFFFAIEHCNRLGWKEKFGFPTTMVMDAIGVKSYTTYIKTLNELVDFGFIKMIEKSKNQYSSNIIAIPNIDKASVKALDKAIIKHTSKQVESTSESIVSIDIPIYKETNKDIFIEIKNFKSYHSNFSGNKKYLLIAYRFWELWKKDNPQNLTIKKAKVLAWVNTIRLIVEVDEQNIERLICILKYFEKCQEENIEYDNFWFKTIKSIGGLRDTNKQGVYRLDSIMDIVNTKIQKDEAFNRLVTDSIENFKNYNHERN